jgi:FO synthase
VSEPLTCLSIESGTPADSSSYSDLISLPLDELLRKAASLRDVGHGEIMTYSRKVFIPLTQLCRDVCHYCTFAKSPREAGKAYLSPEEVLDLARAGERAGCTEALFTLGDKPELRYAAARKALHEFGYETTIDYLAAMSALVLRETSLLPHVNPGVMTPKDVATLRRVSVSQGMMLESASTRLCENGQVHYGSPDKDPAVRLGTIRVAGELQVPFTTGILIGIGETRAERLDALLAIAELHRQHGHIQEVIIQCLRVKSSTKMAGSPDPDFEELLWSIAVARIILGPDMNIQAPPNLTPGEYETLIAAGINDWGGVSPVTIDHVNPEAPWPQIDVLSKWTRKAGKTLVQRLPAYPSFCLESERWIDASLRTALMRAIDADGLARADHWSPGVVGEISVDRATEPMQLSRAPGNRPVQRAIDRALAGSELTKWEIISLFQARGPSFAAVCEAADWLRSQVSGEVVRYVVNRNINYTNVCSYHCRFCAFSKGTLSKELRGSPYDLDLEEVSRRALEAWERGATEVCMQGGIHPHYTGETYLSLIGAVKSAAPELHVHAFSPLEVTHGASTLGIPVSTYLEQLKAAGLGTLPGTAAEILDDEVRTHLCPDKLSTAEWLSVVEAAHGVGLQTTATIMFGHIDHPRHWAEHLLAIRHLQERTGGFTEFVPLPFVHMEAPIYFKGSARRGPTSREAILMHAVARLVLHPLISNIQVSWVKMGPAGVRAALAAGANDLGGTLMNESISRAAGTKHGQEMPPEVMDDLILSAGREPMQRTTLYSSAPASQKSASYRAAALAPLVQTPATWRKNAMVRSVSSELVRG